MTTALVPACLAAAGCTQGEPPGRDFVFRGQIRTVRPPLELVIKHDDIPGFMPAMTMPFTARDPALLHGKAVGDFVTGSLRVTDTEAWVTRLEKTGSGPVVDPVHDASTPADVVRLAPGDQAPDAPLVDDFGDARPLSSWRGSAVALTFVYTRCPLPQFCPMMDRRFAEVQRLAQADPGLRGRVRLLSVSFDPDRDTPAVLRAHAETLGADPATWRFATAPRDAIDRFAAAFGVVVRREADRSITHNLRTAVLDPGGRLIAVYDGGDWSARQIAGDLRQALAR